MNAETYRSRREVLRAAVDGGAILILGNDDAPKNYVDNVYPFRQDSHFLYYAGINETGMAALIEPDGRDILFGRPYDPDDLVWHGPRPHVGDHARILRFLREHGCGHARVRDSHGWQPRASKSTTCRPTEPKGVSGSRSCSTAIPAPSRPVCREIWSVRSAPNG